MRQQIGAFHAIVLGFAMLLNAFRTAGSPATGTQSCSHAVMQSCSHAVAASRSPFPIWHTGVLPSL
jgi:hypothetical protein